MNSRTVAPSVASAVALLAVVVSLAAYGYALWSSPPTRFDDAYMFIRYANNLLAGRGHAWNPDGVQTYGSTSLLHVAAVTALRLCFPRLSDAGVLLASSAAAGFLALAMLVVACARWSRYPLLRNNYLLWAGLLLPVLALDSTVLYHHRTGMDTMLATLCNVLLIFFTLRLTAEGSVRAVIPVVLAACASYAARPDNGLYATLLPALWIMLCGVGPRRKHLAVFGLSMLAVLAADTAWKWAVFGSPLPLPLYAKQLSGSQGYANPEGPNPFVYLEVFLATALPFACAILLFARRAMLPVLVALLGPVALTFAYYFSVHQIMGAAARFYLPALPFVVVAAALALDDRLRAAGEAGVLRPAELLWRLIIVLLVVAVGRQGLLQASAWYQRRLPKEVPAVARAYTTAAASPLPAMDRWDAILAMADIAARAPQGTVIALSEHGLVGASAPQVTLVDLVGLHDPQFALHGLSAAALFERKPDLIWLPHYHYTNLVKEILQSDAFWQEYVFYPRAFEYGLAIRKRSPYAAELSALVREHWAAAYGNREPADYVAMPSRP